ncbi:MAG: chemotaxis protein CheA [Burkholderiales bacterium]|nr:chemotaxis protein CheA [Burkholderiales bacterium]
MSIDLTRFYESFFAESLESLEASETGLLALEREQATDERLNAIFRGLHSIKGAAGSLGFSGLADFTHHVEGALDRLRNRDLETDKPTLDLLLACIDFSRALVLAAKDGRAVDSGRGQLLIEQLGKLQSRATERERPASGDETIAEASASGFHIVFKPERRFFANGNDPLRILKVLSGMGRMTVSCDTSALKNSAPFDPEQCYLAWDIKLEGDTARDEVEEVFAWVKEDCELQIEPIKARGPAADISESVSVPAKSTEPAPVAEESGDRRKTDRRSPDRRAQGRSADAEAEEFRQERLHVSRDKVDALINLVGELVITKTMLKEGLTSLPADIAQRIEAVVQQLERNTRELQDSVMAIRMLPVSHAFGRFGRLVRDVSQSLGKRVDLVMTGEQSELDKSVIEKLVDPLTHLVRNALDHGIETPEERKASGKPETASLRLHAEHKGGNIEIVVSDDGRGVNAERVAAKAKLLGLIDDSAEVDVERACELIFEPGFSTAETVNELSGRGVGLDVVRKNIMDLSGGIRVETAPGQGTAFVIRLPLTLAIIDGMTVMVGQETYIVPMTFIAECVQPETSAIKSVAGRGMLVELRGQYLPLLKLGELIGVEACASVDSGILLVVEADGNRVALLVDTLVGQEQVVIKSLESNFRKVDYIAGATILGQGQVVLILDVAGLVRSAKN